MKTINALLIFIFLGTFSYAKDTLVPLNKKVKQGKKIFKKKLKHSCRFTGAKFAQMHTQDEWEVLKQTGKFRTEIYKVCPKSISILQDKWLDPLYEFTYVYASDSGKFPTC